MDPRHYEQVWNEYARIWEQHEKPPGATFIGDEWGTHAEAQRLFDRFLKPWLGDARDGVVVEIGPGGGKYTVMAAALAREVIALDVAERMLERTSQRAREQGLTNVRCVKISGLDLAPIADASADVAFAFDVLVHLAAEDVYAYLRELRRILKPGGIGAVTLASFLTEGGFAKFLHDVDADRHSVASTGRFGFLTPTVAARFLFHLGFKIVGFSDEINNRDFVVVFEKPAAPA